MASPSPGPRRRIQDDLVRSRCCRRLGDEDEAIPVGMHVQILLKNPEFNAHGGQHAAFALFSTALRVPCHTSTHRLPRLSSRYGIWTNYPQIGAYQQASTVAR